MALLRCVAASLIAASNSCLVSNNCLCNSVFCFSSCRGVDDDAVDGGFLEWESRSLGGYDLDGG